MGGHPPQPTRLTLRRLINALHTNIHTPTRLLRALAAIAILFFTALAPAPPPANYYQTITSQTGSALKLELRAIISGQRGYTVKALSYDGARDALLNSVDNVGSGQVRMLYTNDTRPTSQWATTFNREHTWPQSFGAGSSPKVSDMHHLFLCDSGINSSRGNDVYGFVTGGTNSPNFTGNPNDQNSFKSGVWQASINHRGDVARAILYMETRYSDFSLINRGQTLGSNQMGFLDDLLQWSSLDPVDTFEQQRNDRVFAFQNNRNPYIDNPAWVSLVYGGQAAGAPNMTNLTRTPPAPSIGQTVSVSVTATDSDGIASVQLFWRVGNSGAFTTITMNPVGGGVYTSATSIPAQVEGTLVQYYTRATDTLANSATLPVSGAAGPDSYVVIGDLPVLSQLTTSPSSISSIDTVHIRADVTDDDGNSAANLTVSAFWRVAGSAVYTSIPMSVTTGTTWQTNTPIPAQTANTTIEYYVRATDLGAATATIPAGGAAEPASYFVEPVDPFIQITSPGMVAGKIMVTEFAHSTVDAFTEFLEIVNVSEQGYILDNVMISDDGVGATSEGFILFPVGATIEPGGIIVVFNRDNPAQSFIDTIPPISNRNDAAVQVFVTGGTGSYTFNGSPVPLMVTIGGAGNQPQLSTGDNLELVYTSDRSTEAFTAADVIDGVGWGAIGTANTTVGWGPNVTTSGTTTANNVVIGSNDGAFRNSPTDTDTKNDWTAYSGVNPYTPGLLPPSFEIPKPALTLASPDFNGGTSTLTVTEGGNATLSVSLASNPGKTVSLSVSRTGGTANAADFNVTAGGNLTFTTANFATPQSVVFEKTADPDTTADSATFEFTGSFVQPRTITVLESETTQLTPTLWFLE